AFCGRGSPLLQVESILVDRSASRGWAGVLNDENLATRLRVEVILIMRIRMKDHRAWSAFTTADLKRSLKDVPDRREVIAVQRMMGSRLEAKDACVGLGWAFLPRMEHHLAGLSRPSHPLPFELVP